MQQKTILLQRYKKESNNSQAYWVTMRDSLTIIHAQAFTENLYLFTNIVRTCTIPSWTKIHNYICSQSYSKLVRWPLKLNIYQFQIIYKQGQLISNADALSRMQVNLPETESIANNPGAVVIFKKLNCYVRNFTINMFQQSILQFYQKLYVIICVSPSDNTVIYYRAKNAS